MRQNRKLLAVWIIVSVVMVSGWYTAEATGVMDDARVLALKGVVSSQTLTSTEQTLDWAKEKFGLIMMRDLSVSADKVAIRFDDVQDTAFSRGTYEFLKFALDNNIKLTLAVIANRFGNNILLLKTVREGVTRGLFEIAIHGYNHEDMSQLTPSEQITVVKMAKAKLEKLFPNYDFQTFISPYNSKTIDLTPFLNNTGIRTLSWENQTNSTYGVRNFGNLVDTAIVRGDDWIVYPSDHVRGDITKSLNDNGYALVVYHPQQFLIRSLSWLGSWVFEMKPTETSELAED